MKRIHIIGPAGSGKSYLAKKLNIHTNIPAYELDNIFWNNQSDKYDTLQVPEIRNQMLEKYCTTEKWIIEGVFYKWCDVSFEKADVIIFIKAPLFLCRLRVIRRFLFRKLSPKRKCRDTVASTIKLLKWMKEYNNEDIPAINIQLKKYEKKLIVIRKADKVLKHIKEIQNIA